MSKACLVTRSHLAASFTIFRSKVNIGTSDRSRAVCGALALIVADAHSLYFENYSFLHPGADTNDPNILIALKIRAAPVAIELGRPPLGSTLTPPEDVEINVISERLAFSSKL
ncbi:hypothetical protein RRG08_049990 [Elysia crispata]|uniref:Uncharacterized protein n=1 Tax=Elysia crispata TaxID=231223 RepID=A0AAE1B9M8_9GAST|nr:hypothetical protein RRG08_049990 [Elysia crispata]